MAKYYARYYLYSDIKALFDIAKKKGYTIHKITNIANTYYHFPGRSKNFEWEQIFLEHEFFEGYNEIHLVFMKFYRDVKTNLKQIEFVKRIPLESFSLGITIVEDMLGLKRMLKMHKKMYYFHRASDDAQFYIEDVKFLGRMINFYCGNEEEAEALKKELCVRGRRKYSVLDEHLLEDVYNKLQTQKNPLKLFLKKNWTTDTS